MVFQNSPNALYWVVFTMIRWIVGQSDVDGIAFSKLNDSLDELSPVAIIFRSIIGIDCYCMQFILFFQCKAGKAGTPLIYKLAYSKSD